MLFALSKNVASTTVIETVLIISFMLLEVVAAGTCSGGRIRSNTSRQR